MKWRSIIACAMVFAMPVTGLAATFPAVEVATDSSYLSRKYGYIEDVGADHIVMKQMKLMETEPNAFAEDGKFVFFPEGRMQFSEKEPFVIKNDSVEAECFVEDGRLVVKILKAEEGKTETIQLPSHTVSADDVNLEEGRYCLMAEYFAPDTEIPTEKKTVVPHFVNAESESTYIKSWKITIPVGGAYLYTAEKPIALDTPAYLSKEGYTMLPLRAVANVFEIRPEHIHWNSESKTVTILKGEDIISMQAGEKKISISGSEKTTSGEMEIVNGRAFLPMRDLGNAFGADEILWDSESKTAVLRGGELIRGGR